MLACCENQKLVSVSRAYIGNDTDTNFKKHDTDTKNASHKRLKYRHLLLYQYMTLTYDTNSGAEKWQ
jgi:hypothetical protein